MTKMMGSTAQRFNVLETNNNDNDGSFKTVTQDASLNNTNK